jgi:protein-L-isoaspartate(D-aspartate) O-methyltransferase
MTAISGREARARFVLALRQVGVRDPAILEALEAVSRAGFVQDGDQEAAWFDCALPLPEGQTLTRPTHIGLMLAALAPQSGEKVLEIGTGSGFQTALLARLGAKVSSLERISTLLDFARTNLEDAGVRSVALEWGDGHEGWPGKTRFDGIIINAAVSRPPEALIKQLAPMGRIVCATGEGANLRLVRYAGDSRGEFHATTLAPVSLTPLRLGKVRGLNL